MKKILILAVLFLCVAVSAQAQTYNLNQPSGTIAIGCSEYVNNVNKIWNVNTGQNKAVKITYSLSTEANFDKVAVYSINSSGNAILLFTKSGSLSGTAYSEFPTGKIQVVFTTDISISCSSTYPQYTGFTLNFSVDDRVYFDAPIYLSDGTISSNNSSDLNFQTDGTTRMSIINSNGNVGIGTTAPNTKLDVNGSVYIPYGQSYWVGSYANSGYRLRLHHAGTNAYIDYLQNLYFRADGSGNALTLLQNGNVGIGTTTPDAKLTVNGDIYIKSFPASSTEQNSTRLFLINRGPVNGEYRWAMYTAAAAGGNGVGANAYEIWEYPDNSTNGCCRQRFVIKPSNGETNLPSTVVIDAQGGMQIGNQLSVNGTIRAKEIKIETNWADFVFNDNYRLKPLQEVNEYISDNKRLPDIPSEQEVKENGVNLGDMQTKLLQKVEELTLYIIRQQEMIDKLNARIEQLEKK